ncbi:restriction endonuclease [Virgibacillus phasianinus]|uniref:Restriction endonuclease n=1 Tax=Virgibacillus phasianinus TaxID=2017483 RepID=A0A220U7Y3_9BACI|nr:restriction endonuclease-like protein [Virgibacillus phasianinus]ASK64210.1 restriction endonuclease [Virgibacillus phasianinus]
MALLPSGSGNDDAELVVIETDDFYLYIKGKPYHERYKGLRNYQMIQSDETMNMSVSGENIKTTLVYDLKKGKLNNLTEVPPIFFENRVYQLVVTPKNGQELSFYHEQPSLQKAVTTVGSHPHQLLMGNLKFQNEVGYSTFEIHEEDRILLKVTMEIFPVKLNYKQDYKKLLDEVNEEVYNLAFHFIKKTFLGSTTSFTSQPSWSEFYRLFNAHFKRLIKSINVIERQPHHHLETTYRRVRGDQLKKVDSTGRNFLRKHAQLFQQVHNGIKLSKQNVMPSHGLNVKKQLSYDTLENQFVKWMMKRLVNKLEHLQKTIQASNHPYQQAMNEDLLTKINEMKFELDRRIKSSFWRQISQLKRSVMSLVMQMAPGYRDAYQIYLTVSRGLILHGQLYNMFVKDVATLYEYWTFIKLGQILGFKYPMISQDIIKVRRDGLFVQLDQSASAKRVFKHPITNEKITLHFQKVDQNLPTVSQKPDSMLGIEKRGKDYSYHYIFDAKYRIDFATEGSYYKNRYKQPGPLEEDINTMHRYRDALVSREDGPFERYAFGAYVLFPWFGEEEYKTHHFYKSINDVNIGGFPFLPNSTRLVEQFIERLIEKSPEELQEEGLLPKGTLQEWQSSSEEKVLIGKVENKDVYQDFIQNKRFIIPLSYLKSGWQEARYVGLYLPKKKFREQAGVSQLDTVEKVDFIKKELDLGEDTVDYAVIKIKAWESIEKTIKPVNYGIKHYMMTTLANVREARELPELFMRTPEEIKLWKMLRRISSQVTVELNDLYLDKARKVQYFNILGMKFKLTDDKKLEINGDNIVEIISMNELMKNPSGVFRQIIEMV